MRPAHNRALGRAPLPLLVGFGVFVALMALLVAAPAVRSRPVEFDPLAHLGRSGAAAPGGIDTLTVDARDERSWRRVDLGRGSILRDGDPVSWDIAVRRFRVIAARGAADLGAVPFAEAGGGAGVPLRFPRFASDTTHPAFERWYRYGFLTHLLTSRGHVYLVQGAGGRMIKLELLSYYCTGTSAGCLTIRYAAISEGNGTD
jgi:hypothetical protein